MKSPASPPSPRGVGPSPGLRVIAADQIDFGPDASTAVCSDSLRFVVPVPAFEGGGEPLAPPPAAMGDWTASGRGVVFFNPADRCYQAVRGDGEGVVIFGPGTPGLAERLTAKIREFAPDPRQLDLRQFKAVLAFAREGLGVAAIYDSTKAFVAAAMIRAGADTGVEGFGLYRRRAEAVCRAVYLAGAGVFLGPAASPQQFDDGAVIVRQGGQARLIQPAAFLASYRRPDGGQLVLEDIAAQSP